MKKTSHRQGAAVTSRWTRKISPVSYEKLARGLASEMAECVRSKEPGKFCAPFELVIVDPQGAVVFACQVGEGWKVRPKGPPHIVRRSHFPATALLTDRSMLTRTFQIEPAAC